MSEHTIEVQILSEEALPMEQEVGQEPLRLAAMAVLQTLAGNTPGELTVVITGDETLQTLNCRYRGVDAPTDVLAFPDETRGPFVGAPGIPRYWGDVIISFPQAKRQAAEAHHSVTAELQLLVIHGVLHLLGFDDQESKERERMWAAQSQILHQLGLHIQMPE